MGLKFLLSDKGRDKLVHRKYIYRQEKIVGDQIIWKCVLYERNYSRELAHTFRKESVMRTTEHNHVADAAEVEVKEAVDLMKKLAKETPKNHPRCCLHSCSKFIPGFCRSFAERIKFEKNGTKCSRGGTYHAQSKITDRFYITGRIRKHVRRSPVFNS
ncbi:unnamed protein product [Bemisia tabaci]|uniref:FLYWCH-type domain-containing protein n=1 Tax=Bemisia tabaci TaxID=7038 RepID=A0A9P0AP24_BEMTA|nr:unnamed protein product [Bemisia tabaci]